MTAPNSSSGTDRRHVIGLALSAPFVLAAGRVLADPAPLKPAPDVETRSLDEIHKAALAEGGKLVVYAGGDIPNAYAGVERAFMTRFPGMSVKIVTDLSKYHDARIDLQLARGRLEADVAALQTLQDFDRWKEEGQLLAYKPLDWDAISPEYKDPDGAFAGIGVIAFSNSYNTAQMTEAQAPRDALDYLDPKLKGRIVLTYPHDDDAVLYQFDRIVSAHGWDYMDKLMSQDVQWIRGTVPARLAVGEGKRAVTFTASGTFAPAANATSRFLLPRKDVFQSWPQTAAIFKEAPNKEAAKLYISWMASKEATVGRTGQWSVRRDVPAAGNADPIGNYNTDPSRFRIFMKDRTRIERLKTQFEHVIGPAEGPNPTGTKGVYVAQA
jgi:ABC-type Fe3+ transport system substrate-binding protein